MKRDGSEMEARWNSYWREYFCSNVAEMSESYSDDICY